MSSRLQNPSSDIWANYYRNYGGIGGAGGRTSASDAPEDDGGNPAFDLSLRNTRNGSNFHTRNHGGATLSPLTGTGLDIPITMHHGEDHTAGGNEYGVGGGQGGKLGNSLSHSAIMGGLGLSNGNPNLFL